MNVFFNIDSAYTDFLNKLMKVINEIAPSKEIKINNNNQHWFDREVADLIHVWKKLFLRFKKSKLHIDEKIYQRNWEPSPKTNYKKKRNFY